ncbi:MAG: hypothetical protein GXP44_02050 [bacterium]|nr:hypothetical protein [bacterium]
MRRKKGGAYFIARKHGHRRHVFSKKWQRKTGLFFILIIAIVDVAIIIDAVGFFDFLIFVFAAVVFSIAFLRRKKKIERNIYYMSKY